MIDWCRLFVVRVWRLLLFLYFGFLVRINKGCISGVEVRSVLKDFCLVENIFISDDLFVVASVEVMRRLVELSSVSLRSYELNGGGCEDYSVSFIGLLKFLVPNVCVGVVWNKKHAYNFFIDEKGLLWGVELQTKKVFAFNELKKDVRLMVL